MMAGTSSSNQTSTINDIAEVVSSIEGKLPPTNPIPSTCSIFRVPEKLREHNEKVFEPELVSIGPFHHRNEKLQPMQKIKLWYLHCLLSRAPTRETTLKCFVEIIGSIEEECRACYAGEIGFDKKEFIEMMVIDGCFIIEFFRKSSNDVQRKKEDPVFNNSLRTLLIRNDLFLLENQLPWRVLECLFNKSNAQQGLLPNFDHNPQNKHLLDCLLECLFNKSNAQQGLLRNFDHNPQNKHLLDCLRNDFVGSFTGTNETDSSLTKSNAQQRELMVDSRGSTPLMGVNGDRPNRYPIPSVEELQQAGVKFKTGDESNMLSVTFKNGVMTIPPICIVENTESVFRNLVAFEQCDSSQDHKVSSYVSLLRDLIRTNKDVDFLKQMGILNIFLSTEDTTSFFNRLGRDVAIHGNFLYSDLYHQVHAFRLSPWAVWRRDFLETPKARLSLYFAIMTLYLTLIQTIVAIIAFLPSNRGK